MSLLGFALGITAHLLSKNGANIERIVKVSGVCKKCGLVDLTDGPWDAGWFDVEEALIA